MSQRGRLRPPPTWSVSVAVAGWIGAALVSIVVQVVLVAVWATPSGVGSSAARAAAQVAAGAEVDLSDFSISQATLLQAPLWVTLAIVAWAVARRHGVGLGEGFGLRQRWFDVPLGLACGLLAQLLLVPLIYLPLLPFIDADDVTSRRARSCRAPMTPPVWSSWWWGSSWWRRSWRSCTSGAS